MTRAAFILVSATALTACGKSPGAGGGAEIYGPPPVDVRADASANTQNQPPPSMSEAPVTVYGPPPIADAGGPPTPKIK